jgi:transcriptional regulator with XRE-family HTH domain
MSLSNFIKGWLGEKVVAAGLWLGLSKATYHRFHDVVSRRYIQMIEAGQFVPTIEVAAKIRSALKLTWDELLSGI